MTQLSIRDFHAGLGARFIDLQGFEAVQEYGDSMAEHRACTSACAFMDLSFRGRLAILGSDRLELVNGQVTNNVRDLKPGHGCYAALVNARARMLADMHVLALENELVLDLEPGLGTKVAERFGQFVVANDVQIVDAAPHYGLLSVQGPTAERAIAATALVRTLPATNHESVVIDDPTYGTVYLVNLPRTGTRGFDLYVPREHLGACAERLLAATLERGGRAAGWSAFEWARIEAGIPRYGTDMDETTLPPEALLENRAISYTKGCYSGQEVIARIRTYGQVSKALRGMLLRGFEHELPPPGTVLRQQSKEVGRLTSVVRSPLRGEVIALGYVRRECNGAGTVLQVGHGDEGRTATIVPLPFVGPSLAIA